jgi:trimethyllysine dioxygenase
VHGQDVYGIGFVEGVPVNPKDTESLARRISFIRETHYGGFWDFASNMEHGDTAYSNLGLPAHTDNTYFSEPSGLQCFHLLHHTQGQGGQSLFVDGFNVAKQLLSESPLAFQVLSEFRVSAHSAGDSQVHLRPLPSSGHPILNLDPRTKELWQVRFNNDDRSVVGLPPAASTKTNNDYKQVLEFYRALSEWTRLLRSPKNELWLQLSPGTLVMFNNWRVLHGRSSFTGSRRLCGCYIGMDDFQSRLRVLSSSRRKSHSSTTDDPKNWL